MICFYFYFFTFFESIKEIKIIDFLLNAKNNFLKQPKHPYSIDTKYLNRNKKIKKLLNTILLYLELN